MLDSVNPINQNYISHSGLCVFLSVFICSLFDFSFRFLFASEYWLRMLWLPERRAGCLGLADS